MTQNTWQVAVARTAEVSLAENTLCGGLVLQGKAQCTHNFAFLTLKDKDEIIHLSLGQV